MEVSLKDISKVSAGNSAPKKDEFSNEGTPFIRAGSLAFLTQGKSIDECEKVSENTATKKRLKLFKKGSILFAKSGMSSKMGRIYQLEEDAYVVSHLAIIDVDDSIANPSYIKYFFILRPPFFLIRDDAYPSIKLEDIKNIVLNLPDLPTQNKIVVLLDKASALVQKREESINLLDELLRAQFLEMFGDPLFVNKGFKEINLIEVCTKITDGTHQSPKFLDKGIPFILVSNIVNNKINLNTKKFISEETYDKLTKNTKIDINDILITSVGSYGNPAIVNFEDKFCFQRHIAHIKPKHELINVVFLFEQLKSNLIQRQIERVVKGVAQKTLNLKALKGLNIILPPIELQNEFETIYNNIQSQKETLNQSKNELEHLYNSLLQRAFSGQLNFNVDIELDSLLAAIDIEQDTEKEKHNIKEIATVYAGRLLERIEEQKFDNQTQYQQAKQVVFQMLEEGIIEQGYDENEEAVKLKLV